MNFKYYFKKNSVISHCRLCVNNNGVNNVDFIMAFVTR